ncbi:phytanoyl-CoA dioxygenase family protein [Paraburkholderia sp. WSM4179]|nr:phytanoyl-CoA dioxygenase family protein [Paraburkholderia sp. WSM4179]MDH6148876.1 hypothetical protein [Paraburkholderia sp. WSM4179]
MLFAMMDSQEKKAWLRDRLVVLQGVFQQPKIDHYNAIVSRIRGEVDDGKDDQGYGDRIGQLHQKEPDLLRLASSPRIHRFVRWAFNDDSLLMGSLQFEKGTQQEAHIDAIFFWPEPAYSMAGVWIALEDIHADAGPLFYIPGSHRWPFYRSEDIVQTRPELAAKREEARLGRLTPQERSNVVGENRCCLDGRTSRLRKSERVTSSANLPEVGRRGDMALIAYAQRLAKKRCYSKQKECGFPLL